MREQRLKEAREKEVADRTFQARQMPVGEAWKPEPADKPATAAKPFHLFSEERGAQHESARSAHLVEAERSEREQREFHARSAEVLKKHAFTAAKSNKRARETAPAAGGKPSGGKPVDGKGGGKGGKGGKPSGGKKGGKAPIGRTGAAGGYLERARQRVVKEMSKEIKPKMSAAAKIKKERKDKVNRKRDQKDSKRSGGKLASGIGKKTGAKVAAAKKSAKKPSKM